MTVLICSSHTNVQHPCFILTPSPLFSPQSSMNLPPDKMTLLSQYDNEKKWELVCDQVRASEIVHNVQKR